jgi:hypothetical protein
MLWAVCCLQPANSVRAGINTAPPPIPIAPMIPDKSPIIIISS